MSDTINCGFCGDKRRYDENHDCWALKRLDDQENLSSPSYDFVPSRPPLSDSEWMPDVQSS